LEDNRDFVIFRAPYDDDTGILKQIIQKFEDQWKGHAWFIGLVSQVALFVILLTASLRHDGIAAGWVFVPVFVFLALFFFIPCVCRVGRRNGDEIPLLIMACCIIVPAMVMFGLLLARIRDPHAMPIWGVLIPWFLWLTCGILGCCGSCCIAVFERYNRTEPFGVGCAACLTLTPLIIATVFFCLRGVASDAHGGVSFWVPSLLDCVAPLMVILAVFVVLTCAVAFKFRDEVAQPRLAPLPDHLLVHMDPPGVSHV